MALGYCLWDVSEELSVLEGLSGVVRNDDSEHLRLPLRVVDPDSILQ